MSAEVAQRPNTRAVKSSKGAEERPNTQQRPKTSKSAAGEARPKTGRSEAGAAPERPKTQSPASLEVPARNSPSSSRPSSSSNKVSGGRGMNCSNLLQHLQVHPTDNEPSKTGAAGFDEFGPVQAWTAQQQQQDFDPTTETAVQVGRR